MTTWIDPSGPLASTVVWAGVMMASLLIRIDGDRYALYDNQGKAMK